MRKRRRKVGVPHPVDIHVGGRVRARRAFLGMSQTKLGLAVGLTFQQIQKYERGANRIGSSRLYQFAGILDVPVSFFFEGVDEAVTEADLAPGMSDGVQAPLSGDAMMQEETRNLIKSYYKITDDRVRNRVFELAKAVANSE